MDNEFTASREARITPLAIAVFLKYSGGQWCSVVLSGAQWRSVVLLVQTSCNALMVNFFGHKVVVLGIGGSKLTNLLVTCFG